MSARIRLVCPNCAAQYEVDDDVIPAPGRDVQCSNCGQTWRAMRPPRAEQETVGRTAGVAPGPGPGSSALDSDTTAKAPPADADAGALEAAGSAGPGAAAAGGAGPADPSSLPAQATDETWIEPPPSADDYDEIYEDEVEAAPPPAAEEESPEHARRRALDAAVFDVLREEAEREAAARRAEAGAIESQPDLGLVAAPPRPTAPQPAPPPPTPPQPAPAQPAPAPPVMEERSAFVRGLDPAEAQAEDAAAALAARPRHETLPNIEEINSTLEGPAPSDPALSASGAGRDQARGSGFRTGFILMLVLAAAVVALYAYAPRLSEAVPSLRPALDSFTATVDDGRLWLDRAAQQATEAIRGITRNASD